MRNLSNDMVAQLLSSSVEPAFLIELYFDSGTLRLWTGVGNFTWRNEVYTGGGNLLSFSEVEETQELEAKGLVAYLNGVPSSLIAMALAENSRGRPFKLYFATIDSRRYVATEDAPGRIELEDGSGFVLLENQLVDSPYRLFSGLMDVMEFTDDGITATIKLNVENALIIGRRSKNFRYTNEEQRRRFPNDRGLEFINLLQDKEVIW